MASEKALALANDLIHHMHWCGIFKGQPCNCVANDLRAYTAEAVDAHAEQLVREERAAIAAEIVGPLLRHSKASGDE